MTTKLLAILAICATMLCACEEKPAEYNYSPILKEWAYFLPGSYWVYQNEATKELDSVYVTKAYEKVDSNYADGAFRSFVNKLHVIMRNSKGNSIETISTFHCEYLEGSLNGSYMAFSFLYASNENFASYLSDRYTMKLIESMTINDNVYPKVYEYECETNYFGKEVSPTFNTYYIADRSWIIKKLEWHNHEMSSWSLIRSKIVQ